MDVGILGGTFDPVHLGHVFAARAAKEACGLDHVLLMPSGMPPHKRSCASGAARLEMVRLACEGIDWLRSSDIEVRREGTTYTADTLEALAKAYPDTRWHFIVGADALGAMPKWRRFADVARMCRFVVIGRADTDEDLTQARIRQLRESFSADIVRVDENGPALGSAGVRDLIARGDDVTAVLPAAVEAYIRAEGLYLCRYGWDDLKEALERALKPGRYRHTLGVAETAMRLSGIAGVDPQRARLAGLLHDCAKSEDVESMRRRVAAEVPDTDETELGLDSVLHAPMGMLLAREIYGVMDERVLDAIRRHTIGDKHMTPIDKLIFVSDYIEPNRKPFPGLEEVRSLAEKDMDAAALRCAEQVSAYLRSKGGAPHPKTLAMIREMRSE